MEKEIIIKTQEEMILLGMSIGKHIFGHSVLTLAGDLGAGKTTLTKGIGVGLGITRVITSPTFTILKQYPGRLSLSHFDAYRLEGQDTDLGFEEVLAGDDVCVIEWPTYMDSLLPKERLEITITVLDQQYRKVHLHPIGQRYEQFCQEISI